MHLPLAHASFALLHLLRSALLSNSTTMQGIKKPLGIIDTRVRMTDSPQNGLLSPSFASVLAFDDAPHYTTTSLEDFRTLDFGPKNLHSTDRSGESVGDRDKERRHPRLELDVAFDNYHTLDGFAELLNPQNTPASFSGCNSPGEGTKHVNYENMRARSAPTTLAKGFNWSEDHLQADLIDLPGDADGDSQTRRCVSDSRPPPSASSLYAMKGSELDDDDGLMEEMVNNDFSSLRCVRFTQPSMSPQRQGSGFAQYSLRSTANQQVSTPYRQHKGYQKWRRPTLAGAQRGSSYGSVGKNPHKSTADGSCEQAARCSPRFKAMPCRDKPSRSANLERREQTLLEEENLKMTGSLTNSSDRVKTSAMLQHSFDLALITVSLRQYRLQGTWRFNSLRVLIGSKIIQAVPVARREAKRHIVSEISAENLLLHVGFVVPAIVLRLAHVAVAIGEHFVHSRAGLAIRQLLKAIWSAFVKAIRILLVILGMSSDGLHWEFRVEHQRL